MKVLLVEDDKAKRVTLSVDLSQAGYDVSAVGNAREALDLLEQELVDVVIADLRLPGMDGMELLRTIKEGESQTAEVIIITAYGDVPLAVEAMRSGALDFVSKPFDNREIIPLLENIEKKKVSIKPAQRIKPVKIFPEIEQAIIGQSPQIRRLRQLVTTYAESDTNVLLSGETGTGKDLIASVIHKYGKRHAFPFVKLSCAGFSEDSIESELFGHERGAFTGAVQRKKSRFELAEQGTLYLDDVEVIPPKVQVKLLRVLEEKVFERVGSATPINCDVRIIASTKVDLAGKIAQGTFREDLFYRLKVCEIHVPPLRERIEDIPLLADYHLKRISGGKQVETPDELISSLQRYHWPGNVRELSYMLQRAYITDGGVLSPGQFDFGGTSPLSSDFPKNFKSIIEQTERQLLEGALVKAGGNISKAARSLEMKPSTFRDKLSKYGIIGDS
ncbi:MAG TPA: sigma-54 dependent transcriptional regulator [archaeon]|nr:sigma-54 dependent transcriptional regulator [archaeon]